jgi:hypothetical protein
MRPDLLHRLGLTFTVVMISAAGSGCAATGVSRRASASPEHVEDAVGRTYYIDGAGNWGYGVREVSSGLRRAGYRGRIINWRWSPTFNPALDQTIGRPFAKSRGKALGEEINTYCRAFPGRPVNIIALSAGTGVATWACETLRPPARVRSLILLGSSLSSNYDFRWALGNIDGGIWVYYSSRDGILRGPVRALGTIDGKLGADGAGLVGLHPRTVNSDKIHNIGWSEGYRRLGWSGSHTDATSEPFVRNVLARHIVTPTTPETATITVAADIPDTPAVAIAEPRTAKIRASEPPMLATR